LQLQCHRGDIITNEVNTPSLGLGRGRANHGSTNYGGSSIFRISANELPQGSPLFNYNNFMGAYSTSEQWNGIPGVGSITFRHIGVHAHELFHILGFVFCGIWQDQWSICTGFATGDWSTMHRTDAGPKRKGECLAHLSAARKISAGWATAADITANNMNENIQYINTQVNIANPTDFYRFTDTQSGEQFIIENRQYTGFNSFLPAWWDPSAVKGGLLVFNTKPYTSISSNDRTVERIRLADGGLTAPYTVGSSDPTQIWSVGDPADPFPGSTNRRVFLLSQPQAVQYAKHRQLHLHQVVHNLHQPRLAGSNRFAITNISASGANHDGNLSQELLGQQQR
jgi:hypothetical protein